MQRTLIIATYRNSTQQRQQHLLAVKPEKWYRGFGSSPVRDAAGHARRLRDGKCGSKAVASTGLLTTPHPLFLTALADLPNLPSASRRLSPGRRANPIPLNYRPKMIKASRLSNNGLVRWSAAINVLTRRCTGPVCSVSSHARPTFSQAKTLDDNSSYNFLKRSSFALMMIIFTSFWSRARSLYRWPCCGFTRLLGETDLPAGKLAPPVDKPAREQICFIICSRDCVSNQHTTGAGPPGKGLLPNFYQQDS
ncbi:hypothetical protein EVAR_52070_1 [Eumeta japonica]|uniref:Uncharacterized protein n=1 Tax=Eumeta variegata TaxID=151549 RepID=A0A4C1Y2F2_EUMVA|nr:hypothetical protein EVAR_52070_1 [Eumeta japonica]